MPTSRKPITPEAPMVEPEVPIAPGTEIPEINIPEVSTPAVPGATEETESTLPDMVKPDAPSDNSDAPMVPEQTTPEAPMQPKEDAPKEEVPVPIVEKEELPKVSLETEVQNFKTSHHTIFTQSFEQVNKQELNSALLAYNGLSDEAKRKLQDEKTLLDNFKTTLIEKEQSENQETNLPLELKNVRDAYLYKYEDKHFVKKIYLDQVDNDYSNYKVKAFLEDANKYVWLDVTEIKEIDNVFKVKAVFPTANGAANLGGQYDIVVLKSVPTQGTEIHTFKGLVDAITKNPEGHFVIADNLTASEIAVTENDSSYIKEFNGSLTTKNDKMFTIFDLKKPLFNLLSPNAHVSNLYLKDVNIVSTDKEHVGSLVNQTNHATITNVLADGIVIGYEHVGGLVGTLDHSSTLDKSGFEGEVSSIHSVGGLVSNATRGSKITNSYANVTISAKPADVDRVGGLAGQLNENAIVENSFAKGTISNYGDINAEVGGAIGAVFTLGVEKDTLVKKDTGHIKNLVSYVKVDNGNNFIGNLKGLHFEKMMSNNHFVKDVATGKHVKDDSLTEMTEADANAMTSGFYKKPLVDISLKNARKANYSGITSYQASKEVAYSNMAKLLPFYSKEKIVEAGNKVTDADFITKKIKFIKLLTNDKLVKDFYNEKDGVNKLSITFVDGSTKEFDLSNPQEFSKTGIIDYEVAGLNVKYHPNKLALDHSKTVSDALTGIETKVFGESLFNKHRLYDWDKAEREKVIGKLYLEDNFKGVKDKVIEYVTGLVDNSEIAKNDTGIFRDKLVEKLKTNQDALLVGLTYLDRWYDFGGTRENLLYAMDIYGSDRNSLDLVLNLGNASTQLLAAKDTEKTYSQIIAKHTNIASILDFIKDVHKKDKSGNEDINTWIKETTKAHIYQSKSSEPVAKNETIFERFSRLEYHNMILPLMNIKKEQVYVLTTSNSTIFGTFDRYLDEMEETDSRYGKKMTEIKGKLNKVADSAQSFFDVWYRILNDKSKQKLSDIVVHVFDSTSLKPLERKNVTRWSDEYGKWAFPSVKAFLGPIGMWEGHSIALAYAGGAMVPNVYYSEGDVMHGESTLTHEHTHNLDKIVFFDGHGRRIGHSPESFAMGMFQSPDVGTVVMGMNLIFDATKSDKSVLTHNSSPTRFQSAEDLQKYMQGVFDVLYTLELAEAKVMIEKGDNYIRNYYKKITPKEPTDYKNLDKVTKNYWDKVTNITTFLNEKGQSIKTIDDLVDNDIVSGIVRDDIYGNDNYIEVNMFASHFGILANEYGSSGGLTFRRTAFELLAEKGYYGGMIPYVSEKIYDEAQDKTNVYAKDNLHSDTRIFKEIFKNEYTDIKDFKKKMYKRRENNKDKLREVKYWVKGVNYQKTLTNFDTIVNEMRNILYDNNIQESRYKLEYLKRSIFNAYLVETKEFTESIYKD